MDDIKYTKEELLNYNKTKFNKGEVFLTYPNDNFFRYKDLLKFQKFLQERGSRRTRSHPRR